MDPIYTKTAFEIGKIVTKNYSTSFFSATKLLDKSIRDDIYAIYGFVRLADEIVDTFSVYDQKALFNRFEADYSACARLGFSLNPILYAFQCVVNKYNIPASTVESFIESMRADLSKKIYTNEDEVSKYIFGSAEAVGMMCLRVFVNGDENEYNKLEPMARKLGAAFQKVNFLRDIKHDIEVLDRCYFPGVNRSNFDDIRKGKIIKQIEDEFKEAYKGILKLPDNSRKGVYTAYIYYTKLLEKIKKTPAPALISKRIRLSDSSKMLLKMQIMFYNTAGII
ncbi:MAG: phytoene/squalene synthase family protein [Bacteroidales bacterium]|nr:phytoene/squalene synthase family protein [Bacteroidales bacterium]